MNNIISNLLRFIILLIVQVVICQHICLFGYMSPALFLLALFLLPLELPLSLQYLIGFATGFVVDSFAHTLGVSTFSCTLMMFFRPYIAHLLNGRPSGSWSERLPLDISLHPHPHLHLSDFRSDAGYHDLPQFWTYAARHSWKYLLYGICHTLCGIYFLSPSEE